MPASEKKIVAHLFGRWGGGGGCVHTHRTPPAYGPGYNPFRLKDEEIADMIEGSVLYSLSVSFLLPSCEEIPFESLPASDTISSPKSDMPASEPFISEGTVEHTSNCEFLLKIYHFPSFWKSLSSTKLTYTAIEDKLPFVSQSINNFSDYNISQSVDWECPSLCPLMFSWDGALESERRGGTFPSKHA